MLTLNDGRSEIWQWDTGRTLAVDADCSQVHFSNKVFGRSIDVDVVNGTAIIPDILLQTDKDLNVWAFVGTAENGYTKISKTFKVNRRNKPADYVFTPPEQTTLAELSGRLDRIEESQDPDAIKNAVDDYLKQNPVEVPVQSVNGQIGAVELTAKDVGAISVETDPTVPGWAKQPEKPAYTAAEVHALPDTYTPPVDSTMTKSGQAADAAAVGARLSSLSEEIANLQTSGLTTEQVNALDGLFKVAAYIKADVSAGYSAFKTAFGIEDSGDTEPEKTMTSISATYSGGDVAVGTAVADLTGIVVTAHYSDGSTETVTGYTMSGTIAEGSNTVTVSYGGKTATFTVTGVTESAGNDPFAGTWVEGVRLQSNGKEYATGHTGYDTTDYVDCSEFSAVTISAKYEKNIAINAVVWYDTIKNFISGEGILYVNNNSTSYPASVSCAKPDGAVYCRLCGSTVNVDNGTKRFAEVVTITVS